MSYTKKPSVVKIDPTVTHLQPDQFDNDDPIQGYPFGTSAMRVTTATGFPETSGDVITSRTTDDTGSQIFIGEKAYIRAFEGSVWSSWRELGESSGGGGPIDWDDILNKPSQFPPSPHTHSIDDISGLQDELDGKETPQGAQEKVDAHANRTDNPHNVTKAQVGLGNVDNLSATAIRTDTNRSLRVEVVSSSVSEPPDAGRVIFDLAEGKFKGGTGTEWV